MRRLIVGTGTIRASRFHVSVLRAILKETIMDLWINLASGQATTIKVRNTIRKLFNGTIKDTIIFQVVERGDDRSNHEFDSLPVGINLIFTSVR